jgi:hypothetical protein
MELQQPVPGSRDDEFRVAHRFDPLPASATRARALVRCCLSDASPELRAKAELIVSELATNAIRHARTPFLVRLLGRATVRVEVADGRRDPPVPRRPIGGEADGRGLVIVEAEADRWGFDQFAGGKVVWAELGRDHQTGLSA